MWLEFDKKFCIKKQDKNSASNSEHFSIMNLLKNEKIENVKKVYLTASGGPF